MALLLDAGALIAIDKGDRRVRALLSVAQKEGLPVRTAATVVAQVWRDGRRQVALGRVLAGTDVRSLEPDDARRIGELLGATDTTDVVDGHVAVLARPADRLLTSDPEDMDRLLRARGTPAVTVSLL
jgi:hypothetical protein